MIAFTKKIRQSNSATARNAKFIDMLPSISRYARFAFRSLKAEAQEETVQAVIANAFVAFARLDELEKIGLAFSSVLARFGVAQVRSGRKVGASQNNRDVLSAHAKMKNGHSVDRLDRFDQQEDEWKEIVVEDRHAGPAEVAATRIDFAAWLKTLSSRQRKIAKTLAVGEKTRAVARKFRITPGRVSQMRQELKRAWEEFDSELSLRHKV